MYSGNQSSNYHKTSPNEIDMMIENGEKIEKGTCFL